MNKRSKDIKAIFSEALEKKNAKERAAYLDSVCGNDSALRSEFESLLKVHDEAGDFLESSLLDTNITLDESPIPEGPGTVIGRYKLLEKIGEGGMAVVYMAEQEQPIRRKVALKIIKLGMDTKSIIARFEAERQALAIMDHPNIARVLEAAATETGRPYFVMELVTGISITDYCDTNYLSTKDRLDLFMQVCNAIQHAHQKGIIHRDIKPSNIMVTMQDGKPVPKVIDFGIAKAINQKLTEKTLFTRYAHIIGTPAYMSPEQAELSDIDVDTRSDIYSLGILLYELLTGTTPFSEEQLRKAGYIEMQRVIREEEPTKPSTKLSTLGKTLSKVAKHHSSTPELLRKAVRGDLDWIVMKSLEKDRARRYETAHEMSTDILRHLRHEPITARSPALAYVLGKYLRKHKLKITTTGILIVLLTALVIITLKWNQNRDLLERSASLADTAILSQAREAFAKNDLVAALEHTQSIMNSRHVGSEAKLLYSSILVEGSRPEEALTILNGLLTEEPEIAGAAHALLARIYWEGEYSEEEKIEIVNLHHKNAENLLPETAEAYYLRALTILSVPEKLDLLDQALYLDPAHYESRRMRAYIYQISRRYDALEREAMILIAVRPRNPMGYSLLAFAFKQRGKFEEALKYYDQAIRLTEKPNPETTELYAQRCEVHMGMFQFDEVIHETQAYLENSPNATRLMFHRFCALTALGEYKEANDLYHRTVSLWPDCENQFIEWLKKYVFDTLDDRRPWHPGESDPQGKAFHAMQGAEAAYRKMRQKARRFITDGFSGRWSPDGSKFAFSIGFFGVNGVALYDMQTKEIDLLIVPGKDPAWSPDGRYIAFVRNRQALPLSELASGKREEFSRPFEKDELWIMKADGTEPRLLTSGGWPIWSRDSRHIYFRRSNPNSERSLYILAIDDSQTIAREIMACDDLPTLSPDERYLVDIEQKRVKIVELASQSVVQEWTSPVPLGVCVWSNRTQEICFVGLDNTEIEPGVWIYDLQQKHSMKVLDGQLAPMSCTTDMSKLSFSILSPYYEIWVADLDPNVSLVESLGPGLTVEEVYQEAIARLTNRIVNEPENPLHYFRRAKYYNCLDDQERAAADMHRYTTLRNQEPSPSKVNFRKAENLGAAVNTQQREWHPLPLTDDLSLLFSRGNWEGHVEYWLATREKKDLSWKPAKRFSSLGPDMCISGVTTADGLERYSFGSGEYGRYDIFVRKRETIKDDWGEPINLRPPVNTPAVEMSPTISSDGLELYFSDFYTGIRPGGCGKQDLWVTRRSTRKDAWTEPVNLGSPVNSPNGDGRPCLSADGLALFFDSGRPKGIGGADLYMTRRVATDAPWEKPVNLGPNVNTPFAEYFPHLSADGSTLYWDTDRPGGYGEFDIWRAILEPRVDFNGDGIVDDVDLSVLQADWAKKDSLCDIGPMPWGDGVVNEKDQQVLMAHWGQAIGNFRRVSHWKLDEEEGSLATDSQGEHHGSVHGSAIWQPTRGRFDGALQFDGIDDYVETGLEYDLSQSPLRVFAWIEGGAPGQAIVSQETKTTDHHSVWLGLDPVDGRVISSHMDPLLPRLESESFVTDDRWHQVGLVWDGIYRHLYVDGQKVARDNMLFLPPVLQGTLRIGVGSHLEPASFWSGLIDDIRFIVPPYERQEAEAKHEQEGFQIYDDDIVPYAYRTNYSGQGALDYFWDTNPAEGERCIYWADAAQYDEITIDFRPDKDLTYLVDEGYALEFCVRGSGSGQDFDVRFVDTKTDYPDDHPWRMRKVISTSIAPRDDQWHHVRIPLRDFTEHGSWDNDTWYDPQGDFDWAAIDALAFDAQHGNLQGVKLWFDDIRISR